MGQVASQVQTATGICRCYMEWIPFSGSRDYTGQLVVAAITGGIITAITCVWYLREDHVLRTRRVKARLRHLAVFISGCDSGLGYSLAAHCHDRMGLPVIAGCLSPESEGAKRLKQRDTGRMFIVPLDVTDEKSVLDARDAIQRVLDSKGLVLTALVNNAGVMVFGEFDWLTDRLMRYQVEVNILGTMRLTKALTPLLRTGMYKGRIITVSSHCALATLPGLAVYGATKAALSAWSDGLRLELSKFGVPVITIIPGSFSHQSNILARQGIYAKEMDEAMSEKDRDLYGEYFIRYQTYLSGLFGEKEPVVLQNTELYSKFEHALLSRDPKVSYIISPLRYTIYHFLFKITPTGIRDWLVHRFVQLPEWK